MSKHPAKAARREGRRVRSMHPMEKVSPYIMVNRNDATNYFRDAFDLEEMEKLIHKKREEGLKGFGIMHVILTAYVRTISQYPGINRFLRGQKVYARNDIVVCMDVKKSLALNEQATIIKVHFSPTDTVEDVYRKFNEQYESSVKSKETGFDNLAKVIDYMPGLIKKFVVWLLKFLDYFGLLPKFLTDLSPFHGSMFITSMGSLGIPPIFHHLYNFGNVPVFLAFGAKRHALELTEDGTVEKKTYVDLTVSCDERICDGHYFASGFKYLRRLLKNPSVLDEPPEKVVEDIK